MGHEPFAGELRVFESPSEFAEFIEAQIADLSVLMGAVLRKLERLEKDDTPAVRWGKKDQTVHGIIITRDPTPGQELAVVKHFVDSLQMKLNALERAKQVLQPFLADAHEHSAVKLAILSNHGVPVRLVLYEETSPTLLTVLAAGPGTHVMPLLESQEDTSSEQTLAANAPTT